MLITVYCMFQHVLKYDALITIFRPYFHKEMVHYSLRRVFPSFCFVLVLKPTDGGSSTELNYVGVYL